MDSASSCGVAEPLVEPLIAAVLLKLMRCRYECEVEASNRGHVWVPRGMAGVSACPMEHGGKGVTGCSSRRHRVSAAYRGIAKGAGKSTVIFERAQNNAMQRTRDEIGPCGKSKVASR